MEQEGLEPAGVTRGVNAAFVLPPDASRAASFLTPALDRLAPDAAGPQLLIVSEDAEAAMALAAAAESLANGQFRALAATSAARAARALSAATPAIVAGSPEVLVGLLQRSALKPAGVKQLVLAWLDRDLPAHAPALEALLAELPKDAARTIVVREITPAVEELIERYARRARRVLPAASEVAAVPMQFVSGPDASRPAALRRVLDEADPATAFVWTRDPQSHLNAGTTLRTMGYVDGGAIRAGAALDADVEMLVLYDAPATRAELHEALAGHAARQVIALVQPRQIPALRELAGGVANPFVLPEPAARARAREARLRDELRTELAAGAFAREVLALEPLLAEFDGIEIAAAAVRLLEAERARAATARPASAPKMARLFLNVGETDGIRPGDLVGAIANVGGLTGADVGRIELRDRHALVEVPDAVAATVAEKLTGVTLRGRQIVARLDQERPDRGRREDRPDRGRREQRPTRGNAPRGPRNREDRNR